MTQTWQPSRFCCETHIFNCPLPVSSWGHNTPVFLPTNFTPFFLPLLVLTTCFWRYTACSVGYCIALSSQLVTEKWRGEWNTEMSDDLGKRNACLLWEVLMERGLHSKRSSPSTFSWSQGSRWLQSPLRAYEHNGMHRLSKGEAQKQNENWWYII